MVKDLDLSSRSPIPLCREDLESPPMSPATFMNSLQLLDFEISHSSTIRPFSTSNAIPLNCSTTTLMPLGCSPTQLIPLGYSPISESAIEPQSTILHGPLVSVQRPEEVTLFAKPLFSHGTQQRSESIIAIHSQDKISIPLLKSTIPIESLNESWLVSPHQCITENDIQTFKKLPKSTAGHAYSARAARLQKDREKMKRRRLKRLEREHILKEQIQSIRIQNSELRACLDYYNREIDVFNKVLST